jgi:glycosyltransferase involved in cell wall biosynthesis
MKIALIGSAVYSSPEPPNKVYAPLKLMYELGETLAERGHDVTFFGQTDQPAPFETTNLGFRPYNEEAKKLSPNFVVAYETLFLAKVLGYAEKHGFDIIHSHNLYRTIPSALNCSLPIVVTQHDSTHIGEYEAAYQNYGHKNLFMVAPSHYMTERFAHIDWLGVAHHGLDVASFPQATAEDYLLWVGRIVEPKGLHHAIKIAQTLKQKLKVVGPSGPFLAFPESKQYFDDQIKPHLDTEWVEYLGHLSQSEVHRVMAHASCLLFPTDGTESFGMVVVEAMACGTPVIALNNGPIPELVTQGITGYGCDTIEQMIEKVQQIDQIDRQRCRQKVQEQFSLEVSTQRYEQIYALAINKFKEANHE